MIREIDPATHAVVDCRSCAEIAGAVAADEDTGEVWVVTIDPATGMPVKGAAPYPYGVRIVRRR